MHSIHACAPSCNYGNTIHYILASCTSDLYPFTIYGPCNCATHYPADSSYCWIGPNHNVTESESVPINHNNRQCSCKVVTQFVILHRSEWVWVGWACCVLPLYEWTLRDSHTRTKQHSMHHTRCVCYTLRSEFLLCNITLPSCASTTLKQTQIELVYTSNCGNRVSGSQEYYKVANTPSCLLGYPIHSKPLTLSDEA